MYFKSCIRQVHYYVFLLSLISSVAPLMCEIAPFDEKKKKNELTKMTNLIIAVPTKTL